MVTIFLTAVFIVALGIFLATSPAGKIAGVALGLLGVFVGQSAGLAYEGGAVNAAGIFGMIGVIIGSLFGLQGSSYKSTTSPSTYGDTYSGKQNETPTDPYSIAKDSVSSRESSNSTLKPTGKVRRKRIGLTSKASYYIRSKQNIGACFNSNRKLRSIGLEALEYCLKEKNVDVDRDIVYSSLEYMYEIYPEMPIGDFVDSMVEYSNERNNGKKS